MRAADNLTYYMAGNMKASCKDIDPSLDCSFKASGNTDNEVMSKMLAHMRQAHPDSVLGKSDDEIRTMIKEHIKM